MKPWTNSGIGAKGVYRWVLLSLVSIGLPAGWARAELTVVDNADGQTGLTAYRMKVSPAAASVPVFKHRLLPAELEMRDGNAALFYYRAFADNGVADVWQAIEKEFGQEEVQGNGEKPAWYDVSRPLSDLPMDKVRQAAARFDTIIEQHISRGVVRRECDWGRGLDELRGLDVIALLLPEIQESRQLSRALMLRARVAVADRDFDRAIDQLQMNYRLAQHVAADPILVSGLVGIAQAGLGNHELVELIAAEGSPNFYWALAEMSRPFIDLYPSTRRELSWGLKIFPIMLEPEKQEHSPREWSRLLAASVQDMQRAGSGGPVLDDWVNQLGVAGLAVVAYPDAKHRLVRGGIDRGTIDRMPVGQVIAVDASREYQRIAQEFEKWWYLPYGVARKRSTNAELMLGRKFHSGFGGILASLLMPALNNVRDAQMRLSWQLNALQAVEAIRMHAAETGKLPKTLDEIKIVPVPENPVTGKPFQYTLDGATAKLELPLSDGFTVGYRYEITLDR